MKVSISELQKYFDQPLPDVESIVDAFTFHAFEIDGIERIKFETGNPYHVLNVKVLPNRATDCSSEEGIAAELSAILNLPLKNNPADGFSPNVVEVSLSRINSILGSSFSETEVIDVFHRLRFHVEKTGSEFRVAAPLPRTDIEIPEDVAEEVGRILGYDRVPAINLPSTSDTPDQARYRGIERMKDQLVEQGFTEVSTQSFGKKGAIFLAKPFDTTKPALRTSLEENLLNALERAKQYAPLVLSPKQSIKLFEVGTVFPKGGEYLELRMTERVKEWGDTAGISDNLSIAKLEDYGKGYVPKRYTLGTYKPFSMFPFITRDIAVWVSAGTEGSVIEGTIRENAGELLVRLDQFDHFEREGRVSYAFRLIFQSMERTLTDDEVSGVMTKIAEALTAKSYEVR